MITPYVKTERTLILNIVERWYVKQGKGFIYEQLCQLNLEIATREDIAKIIGNDSWIRLWCDGCRKYAKAVVVVGAEPYYESPTADLCIDCVTKAYKLLKTEIE